MGQAQPKRPTALIVEDDAELRSLTAALLEEEQLDTIECESAEAALAVLLIGGQEIAMIFADVRLPGAMDGIDLAWEVKLRWPPRSIRASTSVSANCRPGSLSCPSRGSHSMSWWSQRRRWLMRRATGAEGVSVNGRCISQGSTRRSSLLANPSRSHIRAEELLG
jgi:CheY-like chemotaxis protein